MPTNFPAKTSFFKEAILNKRMLICIFIGFSSILSAGVPVMNQQFPSVYFKGNV